MAEGLLRAELKLAGLGDVVQLASAGTHAGQPGRRPDPRAVAVCRSVGVDIHRYRARQLLPADFARFSLFLAADQRNLEWLQRHCPPQSSARLALMTELLSDARGTDVPDPYYGNADSFVTVLHMLGEAMPQWALRLRDEADGEKG